MRFWVRGHARVGRRGVGLGLLRGQEEGEISFGEKGGRNEWSTYGDHWLMLWVLVDWCGRRASFFLLRRRGARSSMVGESYSVCRAFERGRARELKQKLKIK